MNNKDSNNYFGWKNVNKNYTLCDFIVDSLIPVFISLVITFFLGYSDVSMLDMIIYVTSTGISVIPVMLSLLLSAYAILMTMYWGSIGKELQKNKENGIPLLKGLNASFAKAIYIMVISILFILIVSYVSRLELSVFNQIINAFYVNMIVFFLLVYLIFFSVWIIKDIVINIYNIGQFSLHFD